MNRTGEYRTGLARLSSMIGTYVSVFRFFIVTCLVVTLICFICAVALMSDEIEKNNFLATIKAEMIVSNNGGFFGSKNTVEILTYNGTMAVRVSDVLSHPYTVNNSDSYKRFLLLSSVLSLLMGGVISAAITSVLGKIGGKRFVRGGLLANKVELKKEETAFNVGAVPVSHRAAKAGIAILGDAGVGKSQQIHTILNVIAEREEKAVIYDRTGDLTRAHFREGFDVLLNPFDVRMPYWSIFNELETDFDPERIARSFSPTSAAGRQNSNVSHWEDTPMQVLADTLRRMAQKGEISHSKLLAYFDANNLQALNDLLKGCQSQSSITPENDKHAYSILSSLSTKLSALRHIESESKGGFSLRKWVSDPNEKRRIFITVKKTQYDVLKPLITFWADIIIAEALSLPESSRSTASWYIFDEFQSLGRMQSILDGLNEIRKMNGRILLSVTSLPILRSVYGEDDTQSMLSTAGTKLIYQNGEPKSAAYLSDLLTKTEVIRGQQTMREKGHTDVADHKEENALVSASEIQNLGDFNLIVKQSGMPIVKARVEYKSWPNIAADFILKSGISLYSNESAKDSDGSNEDNQKGSQQSTGGSEKAIPSLSSSNITTQEKSNDEKSPPAVKNSIRRKVPKPKSDDSDTPQRPLI